MIRITSKRHNFRRCRIAHPKGPTEYPDDRFTPAEMKVLQAEPMLTVEIVKNREKTEVKGEEQADPGEQIEGTEEEPFDFAQGPEPVEGRPDLTVREIKERLEEMGVEFSPKAKKEELQKMLAEKMSERVVPE